MIYLRKRKIEAYTEFLDQINKFYPYDIKLYSLHRLKHSFAQEITKLEKYVWRIHVLGTYEVVGQAHELQSCFIHTLSLSQKGEHDEATK